jgi:hypothetical protein
MYKVQQQTNYAIVAGTAISTMLVEAILLNTGSISQNAVAQQTGMKMDPETGMMMTMNAQTGMMENKTDMMATMDPNTGKMMIDNSKTGQMMDPNTGMMMGK